MRKDTNANADVCRRLLPEWSELLSVAKTMASTSSRVFKGQTKSPVYALEKDGQLQHRLFNVLSLIGNSVRGPHCLGDHSASGHESAVKKPIRGVEWLCLGVQSSRTNKEEIAFSVGIRRRFNVWNGVALQQTEDVLLCWTTLERMGNVAIYEKRLRGKGQEREVDPDRLPHFFHLVVLDFE
jgi:hypothetical protein